MSRNEKVLLIEGPDTEGKIHFIQEGILITATLKDNGSVRIVVDGPAEENASSWPSHEYETPPGKTSETNWWPR